MADISVDVLLAAAAEVDVIELAGRIIGHPRRHGPSTTTAETVALANAVERFWAVAIEAELLVRALALPVGEFTCESQFAMRDHAIESQAAEISRLMAAIRGETTREQANGTD